MERIQEIQLPQMLESNFALSSLYLKVLSVAFFKTYLAEQPEFKPYLTESYLKILSQQPSINLLRSLDSNQLKN